MKRIIVLSVVFCLLFSLFGCVSQTSGKESTTAEKTTVPPTTKEKATAPPTTEEKTTIPPTTAAPSTAADPSLPSELQKYTDGLVPEGKKYRVTLDEDDWYMNYRSAPVFIDIKNEDNNVLGKLKHGTEMYVEYIYNKKWAVFQKDGRYVFASLYSLNDPSMDKLMEVVADHPSSESASPPQTELPVVQELGGYAYLAGADFRRIRREYSRAVALAGYVVTFSADYGDGKNDYALTYVKYKITDTYSETTLHNLTTGRYIVDPYGYYDALADRSMGSTFMFYTDVSISILEKEQIALDGIAKGLETGAQSGPGVYVDAATLNM